MSFRGSCDSGIFEQHGGSCWINAMTVCLFLPDSGRRLIWSQAFQLEEKDGIYIPRALKKLINKTRISEYAIFLEIVRQSLEIALENTQPRESGKFTRQDSLNVCNKSTQLLMTHISPNFVSDKLSKETGKKSGGSNDFLFELSQAFKGITVKYHKPTESYNLRITKDSYYMSYKTRKSGHAVAFIKCQGVWLFFDNNRGFTELNLESERSNLTFGELFEMVHKNRLVEYTYDKLTHIASVSFEDMDIPLTIYQGHGANPDKLGNLLAQFNDIAFSKLTAVLTDPDDARHAFYELVFNYNKSDSYNLRRIIDYYFSYNSGKPNSVTSELYIDLRRRLRYEEALKPTEIGKLEDMTFLLNELQQDSDIRVPMEREYVEKHEQVIETIIEQEKIKKPAVIDWWGD